MTPCITPGPALPLSRRRFTTAGAVSLVLAPAAAASQSPPVARTTHGMVRGVQDGAVMVFKGVPYGAVTRWQPPAPPARWSDTRDCTRFGPMCPQGAGLPMPEEAVMLQRGPVDEDCLTLNVFTPSLSQTGPHRPVMVWFHGGGFNAGSGNAASYDGRRLAERHGVVLVSVTHRINLFGFLYLPDLLGPDCGNLGMLDCVAALQWVHHNIAAFGGHPGLVTIVGQSGGGAKVSTLMAMPAAAGLFHRAIAQSGAELHGLAPAEAGARAHALLAALSVTSAAALRALPPDRLVAAMDRSHFMAGPVTDGRALPHDPFDPTASALCRGIPFMLGTMQTEATFFPNTPLDPIDEAALARFVGHATNANPADTSLLIETFRRANPGRDNSFIAQLIASQIIFQRNVDTEAERKADQAGAPVYVYYFTKTTPVRGGRLHCPHTLDIPYMFDNLAVAQSIAGPVTAANQALADRVCAAWVSFARTGNPNNPKLPHWPRFDTATRPIMIIDDDLKVAQDPLHATRLVLAEIRGRTPPPPGPR